MKFLKKVLSRRQEPKASETDPLTLAEFWKWFLDNEARFYDAVKSQDNVQFAFVNPVFNKLSQVREGAYLLVGMMNDNTAEVIFTAEGRLLSFPYISEIVDAAPEIENWQFTAFKPSMDFPDFAISMGPKIFSTENIFFYADEDSDFPDEISIKLVYSDSYDDDQRDLIENGTFIFLDNYLGEVKTATQIDTLSVEHDVSPEIKIIPITKLGAYILWREKEFTEKYEGSIHNSDESNYSSLEWEAGDRTIVGVVNSDLIRWDKKASHPWVMIITIQFDENENNGMPNGEALQSYYQFEDKLRELLPDSEGFVNIGQTTGLGKREIYYANTEFAKPIKVLTEMKTQVDFEYEFEVFKDKYWRSMNHFEH